MIQFMLLVGSSYRGSVQMLPLLLLFAMLVAAFAYCKQMSHSLVVHRIAWNQCDLQVSQFRDLPPQTIENIALVLTEKVFPPKSVIHYQGNEVEDLFFIQRGHIKVGHCEPLPSVSISTSGHPHCHPSHVQDQDEPMYTDQHHKTPVHS